ncbi:hypothetical protein [Pararcticibacter amylolyticus]|uniref:hypothetical protein n=1 Tax=Pararcticibacter amylolyticus TaxID=2173175 RepID=UPI0011B1F220|nr:hypothetical protein [Pararcticibacter amylolyticus]
MKSIKIIPVCCLLLLASLSLQAQTFAEWWSQKKTQKKYLIEQIAALQVYLGYAKKGYEIAGTGLSTIRDITNGEFKLHELFITELKKVSPAIRNDVRIAEIISMQLDILKTFNGLASGFSGEHLEYVLDVKAGVINECLNDLEQLYLVITSGKAEMTDDERIKRLNQIFDAMQDKSAFTQDFYNKADLFLRLQEAEKRSTSQLRRYHE